MKKLIWAILLMIWAFLAVIGHVGAQGITDRLIPPAQTTMLSNVRSMLLKTAQTTMQTEKIEDNDLYAQAAVLMDAESGRVLYGKNADQILAMASTTKIMTCIVALENAEVAEMVEISAYAAGMPEVKLGARKGESYPLGDLLYSLMLESHNDVAAAIAEHIGKRYLPEELQNKSVAEYSAEESKQAVAAFAALMNDKAAELGCSSTWFITPNGLDADETIQQDNGEVLEKFHSTTAKELALIMSYCILRSPKSEEFLAITQTPSHTFTCGNGRSFACYNHNAFLSMMTGAISGKTGFTNRAGYCYVGALERDDRTFVVALLACGWPYNKNYKWSDTRKLMEYGVENYYYRSFLDEETIFDKKWLEPIPVVDGQTDVLGEQAYIQVEMLDEAVDAWEEAERQRSGLLMKAGEEIVVEYSRKEMLTAPVEEGTAVGEVRYMVDGVTYRTEEIVTAHGVEEIDWQWCLEKIFERFLLYN